MNLHDFYKEHYFYEANRRHQLSSAMTIPIGVLTLLVGALVVIVRNVDLPFTAVDIIQVAALCSAAIFMAISFALLIRSYYNYSYGYIATPLELKNHYEQLVKYYTHTGGSIGDADIEIEEYINSEYARYAHMNAMNNDTKSSYIHQASGFLIAALLLTMVSAVPYVLNTITDKESDVQKIEIVSLPFNYKRSTDMTDEKETQPPPQKQETPPEIVKPAPPPGRIIKENSDKGEKP